jgi:hypothetical protein
MSGSVGPFVLDGNAIAGLLQASFGREMTMAAHNCRLILEEVDDS